MKGRLTAALLLIIIGLAWIVALQGRVVFPGGLGTWWPSIIILAGIVSLAVNPREWRGSAAIILVGVGLQAWRLGFIRNEWWAYLAPAVLIAVGLLLLLPARARAAVPGRTPPPPGGSAPMAPENVAVFGERRLESPAGSEYQGGEVTAVFGTLTADLTRAALPPEGARLKATSVFGGVNLRVPPTWNVEVHGTPILGRTENRVLGSVGGPRLTVDAVAVFGEITVSSG